jgi:hypothetical protein
VARGAPCTCNLGGFVARAIRRDDLITVKA